MLIAAAQALRQADSPGGNHLPNRTGQVSLFRFSAKTLFELVSGRQPQLLAQALVEHLGRRETTQHADLSRNLAGGVAPPRAGVGRGQEHYVSYHLRRIGRGHHSLKERVGTSPSLIIFLQRRIGFERVLIEDAAGIGRLDERDADVEGTDLVVERFRISFERVLGRRIVSRVWGGYKPENRADIDDAPGAAGRIDGNTALVTRMTPNKLTSNRA